ncbi:MAG TPA: YCF48-related protein [Longimicrobiaceae bacterium]|nr:YCF48-related protein [Longimicrobiaceae bacterium]
MRLIAAVSAAALALASFAVAFRQTTHPDPFRPATLPERLLYPMQANAFAQGQVIRSDLRTVFALDDGEHVWSAGTGGLLLRSTDGGWSWEKGVVVEADSATRARALRSIRSPEVTGAAADPVAPVPVETAAVMFTPTVLDVLFADSLHGWAVDEEGGALVTWDGGRRWTHVPGLLPARPAIRPGAVPSAADSTPERMARHLVPTAPEIGERFEAMSWSSLFLGLAVSDSNRLERTSDGGRTWQPLFSALPPARIAAFTSTPHGNGQAEWVAIHDASGIWSVLRATDRGSGMRGATRAWASAPFPPVASLLALDSLRVLAFTQDGRLLRTRDGGSTWPDTIRLATVREAFFTDQEKGWAVGDHGTVYSTTDGGASWRLLSGGGQRLAGVDFADRRVGWAVGSAGVVLATRSGGRRWSPQESGTRSDLHDVHTLSRDVAVAVGDGATVLRTEDGGESWARVQLDSATLGRFRPDLRSVQFTDEANGWIAGDSVTVLATNNGGRNWRRISPTSGEVFTPNVYEGLSRLFGAPDLLAIHVFDARHILVAQRNGFIAETRDGGHFWAHQDTRTGVDLHALGIQGREKAEVWAVGAGGTVLHAGITTLEEDWERVPVPTTATLTDIRFTHPDTGWITGHDGVLLSTTDGGASWQSVPSGTRTDLLALASAEGRTWAVGEGATVLARRPGGDWEPVRPGTWWPAPWYLATWVVVLALVAVAARPAPPPALPRGVAGIAANDRPLDDEARDAFQLREVSAVISRFLRNDHTDPPLTLAVTGPWGSGKTSLMNLVCADLRKNRWRPVLFNAWHYQTEEHLLAALLENVRAQAIPGLLEWGGLRFRWRLFWIRFARFRPAAIAALLLGFLYAGYLSADPERLSDVVTAFTSPVTPDAAEAACKQVLSTRCLEFGLRTIFPGWEGLTALLGALALLATVGRTVRAFGANPATLFRKAAEGTRLRSLEEQASFRHRFAREFEEVTEALKPNDMVIFVDDLDRCRPKHVLDVLEGINFLVSSGRCVVIMGMDPERVVRCVGLGFRDEAEEVIVELPPADAGTAAPGGATGGDADDRRKRSAFARQYLEKLVNIEVPVPTPGAQHFAMLAGGNEHRADARTGALDRASRWVERHGAQTVWVAIAFGMLLLGRTLFAPSPAVQPPLDAENPPAPAVEAASPAPTQPTDTAPAVATPAQVLRRPARAGDYISRQAEEHSTLVVWIGLALTLLLAWRRLANRAEPTLQDSQAFRVALKAWAPYVARQQTTPRAFKKFLNRVRYYAMRQRIADPSPTRWRRLLDRVTGRVREPGLREGSIPEDVLVALAALHECEPGKIRESDTYSEFRRVAEERMDRSRLSPDESAALVCGESIDPAFRERFAELTAGVRVS